MRSTIHGQTASRPGAKTRVAGNLFDVDTPDPTQSTSATPSATIAFEVAAN